LLFLFSQATILKKQSENTVFHAVFLHFALLNKGISGNTAEHNLVTVFFEKLIYYEKRCLARLMD
jgi:hypothetical protein